MSFEPKNLLKSVREASFVHACVTLFNTSIVLIFSQTSYPVQENDILNAFVVNSNNYDNLYDYHNSIRVLLA